MVDRGDRKGDLIDHDAQNDQARALAAAPAASVFGTRADAWACGRRLQTFRDVLQPAGLRRRLDSGAGNQDSG